MISTLLLLEMCNIAARSDSEKRDLKWEKTKQTRGTVQL